MSETSNQPCCGRDIYFNNNKAFIKTTNGDLEEAKFCPSCGKNLPLIQKFLRILFIGDRSGSVTETLGHTALKEALEGEDGEAIKAKTEALSQSSMKLGEAIYKATQEDVAAAADAPMGDDSPADENVVDADFEEVDDDKKDKST